MYNVFPLHRTPAEWLEDSGVVLFSWAIFNPNGPTISCIGLRQTGARHEQEVFYRWMHFLGGEDYCLGYIDGADPAWETDLREVLAHALSLDVGEELRRVPLMPNVPSFVRSILNEQWDVTFRDLLAGTAAFRDSDWGRERYLLQKYGHALFSRAGEETRQIYEDLRGEATDDKGREMLEYLRERYQHVDGFLQWKPDAWERRRVQDGDVEAWWSTVASDDFLMHASLQFAQAWVGSSGMPGLDVKTSFDDVREFLRHYGHEIWPPQLTTAWVRESLGL